MRGVGLNEQGQYPDFKQLTKRLTAHGLVVFAEFSIGGKDAVIPGTGLSVEDFVGKVLLEFTLGKIKHHKSRGSLITVLGTAMRNDIIDALRKKSHEREETRSSISVNEDSELQDHEKRALDDHPQQSAPDPISVLDEGDYRGRVRSAFDDEPALKEVVEAVLDLDLYKPEEIADAIGTNAADIQNRKKKLRRRLREKGLVTDRRKKTETYEESHS
jgi:RNA polymerase sigma factor (sigma-70 family)